MMTGKLGEVELSKLERNHIDAIYGSCLRRRLVCFPGVSGYNLDTAVLAMDYRTVGFRECAAEVARYLISVEGMDIQDPMRLRLMNHLQCYCAQRDAAARASIQNSTWSHHPHHHHHLAASNSGQPVHYGGGGGGGNVAQQHPSSQVEQLSTATASSSLSVYVDTGRGTPRNHQHHHHHHHASLGGDGSSHGGVVVGTIPAMRLPPSVVTVAPQMPSSAGSTAVAAVTPMGGPMMISGLPSVHSQFLGVNSVAMLSPNGFHYGPSHQNVKPYRPWGSELVY